VPESIEMRAMDRARGFGEQDVQWLAQHLRCAITEDSLGSGIEEGDAVRAVSGDYRVGGERDDAA
jgi:hypothetical protein